MKTLPRIGLLVVLAGALLTVVASILPWALVQGKAMTGISGWDGKITLIAAGLSFLMGVWAVFNRPNAATWMVFLLSIAMIGVVGIHDFIMLPTKWELANGLYLLLIGGGGMALGSFFYGIGIFTTRSKQRQ